MRKWMEAVNTPGGHIVVLLFVIVIGIVALKMGIPRGDEILIGALAVMWPLLGKVVGSESGK